MNETFEDLNWSPETRILIILAHPDDPEFFMGSTIAFWCSKGFQVDYLLLTQGGRGVSEEHPDSDLLKERRKEEQKAAASVLGVHSVHFFDEPDGFLRNSEALQKRVVRYIRQLKPDVIVSSDPTLYYRGTRLNHHDHRTAGDIVAEAVFPAALNAGFHPDLLQEGLMPHSPKELWFSLTDNPNMVLELDAYWSKRVEALKEHQSQIKDIDELERYLKFFADEQWGEGKYRESFRRLVF